MINQVNWTNPYAKRDGEWLWGNLHTHTKPGSPGCGSEPVAAVIDHYVEKGYNFLAISDHMVYTEAEDSRVIIIPGIEWNSPERDHTGIYSLDTSLFKKAVEIHNHEELLASLAGSGALVVLNHPNWQLRPHYRREELEQRCNYGFDGIEIYNGVIERLDGYAISTDKWDYLLAKGHRMLGFAHDDSHCEADIGLAANVVRVKDRSPQGILDALKSGNFYGSSGLAISDIRREGDIIEIETEDAQEIQVIRHTGVRVRRVFDRSISFNFKELDSPLVRFALYGKGSDMAWTQPFYKE